MRSFPTFFNCSELRLLCSDGCTEEGTEALEEEQGDLIGVHEFIHKFTCKVRSQALYLRGRFCGYVWTHKYNCMH